MKKNKKYWKKQAKQWEKIAGIESESANEWAYIAATQTSQISELEENLHAALLDLEVKTTLLQESYEAYSDLDKNYIKAIEKAEKLAVALEAAKKELSLLRQYNIGKPKPQVPPYTVNPYPTTTVTTGTGWYKNIPEPKITTGAYIPVGMDDEVKENMRYTDFSKPKSNSKRWWKRSH